MPKKKKYSSPFLQKNFLVFLFLVLSVFVTVGFLFIQKINFDSRSKAALESTDFLQAQGSDLVYKGIKVTLRGANFDNIPAMGADIGSNNIDSMNVNEADYKLMSSYGGNHVRLGLSYTWWEQNPTKFFQVLDQHVKWAKENNIWLALLTFTNPDGNNGCYEGYGNHCSLWTNTTYQAQLTNFWLAIASRYANEPAVAGYDLVNEPTPPGPGWCNTWWDLAQKMRNSVAQVAPNQLVFIEACDDPSFARIFKETNGTKAKNVVYEVHDYDPMRITHTGYNASNTTATYPGEATTWIDGVQKTLFFDKSTFQGTRYSNYSTAQRYSIDWAKQNDVPIYIGEWGAQGWAKGYVQFIQDKASLYTSLGVNHAYYTWRHQVTDGWRWGVFTRDSLISPEPAKVEAMKVSLVSSIRPNFGGGAVVTPAPTSIPSVMPTTAPTAVPTSPMPTTIASPITSSTPRPSATPIATSVAGYPKVLAGTSAKITLTEEKPRSDTKIFVKAGFDSSVTGYQVDWYINGKWSTSDKSAPFYLGGDSNGQPNGYVIPSGTTSIRAVVYYSGQNYIDSTTQYTIGSTSSPISTVLPSTTPRPSATPLPSSTPTPAPVSQSVTGNIDIFNEWSSGYCARIVVRNTTSKPVRSWKFYFDLNDSSFTSKWNGSFFNLFGRITVTPNSNVMYLPANGMNNAVDFCATKKGTNWKPTNITVTAKF